jgi:glyoxylase-like metal-dependent hydrolase (beta-lactamase superfamily II)
MAEFPKVRTVTGKFMFLPRDHVHAYVIELENAVVVVDSTLALSSARDLRTIAESFGKPIEAVLMTHGHPDHYTGLAVFEDLPRFASQGGLDFAHREDIAKAHTAKTYLGDDYPEVRVFPNEIIKDGTTLTFDNTKFTFRDLGPGESDSDGMWLVEKDGFTHAFVGDSVANRCHCFFRDGHTKDWLKILDRLEKELSDNTMLYIGHGATPSTKEAIEWQRGYIKTYHTFINELQDKSVPVSRATQEKLIATMQKYLPGEATLFLLDYEMDVFMPEVYKQLSAI